MTGQKKAVHNITDEAMMRSEQKRQRETEQKRQHNSPKIRSNESPSKRTSDQKLEALVTQ